MIIGGLHWFFAAGIAVSIHLMGMLWLSVPAPARQLETERTSETIVVMLGRNAWRSAGNAETLKPGTDMPVIAAMELEEKQTEPAKEALQPRIRETQGPVLAEAAPVRVRMELGAVNSADPIEISTVRTPSSVESKPTAPETAAITDSTKTESVEETPSRPVITEMAPKVESSVTVPTEIVDDFTVPESVEASTTMEEAGTLRGATATPVDSPAVEVGGVEPASDTTATVEDATSIRPDESESAVQLDTVDAESAGDVAGIEVAAIRQPVPEVEPTFEPDAAQSAQPETIDLKEFQEGAGGSGVAARYAGVIEGWLKKNTHYPRAARLAGQEGEVVVRFVINRGGKVQFIEIEAESGFPLLDREAREMIERGDPFPGMPDDMSGQELEVRVPVSFNVRDETLTKEIPPIYLE